MKPPTFEELLPALGHFRLFNWHLNPEERANLNGGFCVSLINGACGYGPTPALAASDALLNQKEMDAVVPAAGREGEIR